MANFSLLAKLGLDSKGFQQGLNTAKKKAQGFQKNIGKIFAAGAALSGLAALVRKSIEFGSVQSDVASQLKINTEAFQVFTGAIRDAGGSQEQMRKSLIAMQAAIVQGSEGLTTYLRAFERLGLNIDEIRKLDVDKQFEAIAKAVATAKDQQGAFTAVVEIFGRRNAPALIEVMERLAREGFGGLATEIKRTYGIMDEETQRALDAMADRFGQLETKTTNILGRITVQVAGFVSYILGNPLKLLTSGLIQLGASISNYLNLIFDQLVAFTQASFARVTKEAGVVGKAIAKLIKGDFQGAFEEIQNFGKNGEEIQERLQKRLEKNSRRFTGRMTKVFRTSNRVLENFMKNANESFNDMIANFQANIDKAGELKEAIGEIPPLPSEPPSGGGTGGTGTVTGGTGGDGGGTPADPMARAREIAREAFAMKGSELAKKATEQAKAKGMRGTRFERTIGISGEEMFRRFDGGRLAGEFTKEQLAAGIGKEGQAAEQKEDRVVTELEKINEALGGKFVNE
jgi:hypothetical protein